jgi:hypothetical protein
VVQRDLDQRAGILGKARAAESGISESEARGALLDPDPGRPMAPELL